jgi:DNA repair protein RadC
MSRYEGHRERVRKAFLTSGLDGFSEHRVLELLLFYAIPRRDVVPLAHTLLERFGSLAGVLDATVDQLMAVPGVGERTAALIKLVTELNRRYLNDRQKQGDILSDTWKVRETFLPCFFGARNEMVYLACLDAKHKMLGLRKLGEGTVNTTEITGRRVVETALTLNASAVILAHNHISGLAIPSREDVAVTYYLYELLQKVGVELYDHVVFADDDMVSMRESGTLPPPAKW